MMIFRLQIPEILFIKEFAKVIVGKVAMYEDDFYHSFKANLISVALFVI